MLLADAFQVVDGADAVMLPQQGDGLRAEALNLEQLERGGRVLGDQQVAPLERSARGDLLEHGGEALPDAGDVGDLALRVFQDVLDALGVALDDGSAVAIAADAEGVLGGDLHEISGLGKQSRDLPVLHVPILALCPPASGGSAGPATRTRAGPPAQHRRNSEREVKPVPPAPAPARPLFIPNISPQIWCASFQKRATVVWP